MKGRLKFNGGLILMALSLLPPLDHTFAQTIDATNQGTATLLERLQGTWEGRFGQEHVQKVTITIAGNSLRYHGQTTNDWYETTFTLPEETVPRQLRATITACHQTNDIGAVVRAIVKIEEGTLTLVGIQDRDKEPPKDFSKDMPAVGNVEGGFGLANILPGATDGAKAFEDDSVFRYQLRKVQPQKKIAEEPTTTR